jgi:hypothetical protein
MGTNFYHVTDEQESCPECGQQRQLKRHIGKASVGWHFALHVYPEHNINDLFNWFQLLNSKGHIEDEYGDKHTAEALFSTIVYRKMEPYVRTTQWYEDNYAESGYHNLSRSIISPFTGCTSHGWGTWDYFVGDFS